MQRRPSVRPAPLPPPFISLAAPVPRVYPSNRKPHCASPRITQKPNRRSFALAVARRALLAVIAAFLLLLPPGAQAGMSMPTLTQVASARLDVISFFFAAYFVLAFIYQRLWNSLARDLPKLPRLSYRGRPLRPDRLRPLRLCRPHHDLRCARTHDPRRLGAHRHHVRHRGARRKTPKSGSIPRVARRSNISGPPFGDLPKITAASFPRAARPPASPKAPGKASIRTACPSPTSPALNATPGEPSSGMSRAPSAPIASSFLAMAKS